MTRHQTVQPRPTNRAPNTPHTAGTPKSGPGAVQPIPAPARPSGVNDKPTPGGAGDLGPAAA